MRNYQTQLKQNQINKKKPSEAIESLMCVCVYVDTEKISHFDIKLACFSEREVVGLDLRYKICDAVRVALIHQKELTIQCA